MNPNEPFNLNLAKKPGGIGLLNQLLGGMIMDDSKFLNIIVGQTLRAVMPEDTDHKRSVQNLSVPAITLINESESSIAVEMISQSGGFVLFIIMN